MMMMMMVVVVISREEEPKNRKGKKESEKKQTNEERWKNEHQVFLNKTTLAPPSELPYCLFFSSLFLFFLFVNFFCCVSLSISLVHRTSANEYQTAPPALGVNTTCASLKTCRPTEYESRAPTATTNRGSALACKRRFQ